MSFSFLIYICLCISVCPFLSFCLSVTLSIFLGLCVFLSFVLPYFYITLPFCLSVSLSLFFLSHVYSLYLSITLHNRPVDASAIAAAAGAGLRMAKESMVVPEVGVQDIEQ